MSAAATGSHEHDVGTRPRRIPARLLRLAPDERLVELLRGGSEAAFEALYARHHRGVLSFCRHMLGSPEEAEDAVQHTFLAAYRDLRATRKEIALRPWLYAIARNRCITVLRARRELAEPHAELSTEQLSAEVERRLDLRALLGDLRGLPDEQRAALVLAELGDLSHDEIGAALGCPKEKVKALVFQARSSLIASRDARETSCADIREQLANLRGGALRRNLLRRHLRDCEGCRAFHEKVRVQRRELALILPVTPTLGLKAAVLAGGGAGGAAASTSIVAKTAIVLAVAGGGTAAVETVREGRDERPRPAAVAPAPAPVKAAERAAAPLAAPTLYTTTPKAAEPRPAKARGPKPDKARPPKARGPKRGKASPPGHAKKPREHAPPGQAKKSRGHVPPGRAKKSGEFVPPGRAKKTVAAVKPAKPVPPGQAKKAVPAEKPVPPGNAKKAEPPAAEPVAPGKAKKQ